MKHMRFPSYKGRSRRKPKHKKNPNVRCLIRQQKLNTRNDECVTIYKNNKEESKWAIDAI